jgi:hypothetical protein
LISRDEYTSLLSSWKSLMSVLSKEQPVSMGPAMCRAVADNLLSALVAAAADADGNGAVVTAAAELWLVLLQRWQTK